MPPTQHSIAPRWRCSRNCVASIGTRERYTTLKHELAALDFDDLEQRAVALLTSNADVRTRWQREVDALLVDEFQDTNSRQRDLVRLLNGDGRRLFIVGDAKQSIYRFRGAEVQVFRAERTRIETEGGVHTPLTTSYRSHAALLERLNTLLSHVLDRDADPERPWREPFARLEAGRRLPQWTLNQPSLEVLVAPGSKGDGALERAAAAIAARLKELVATTPGLTYAGVAVLCRASTSFAAYEDAFEEAGIPYATVAGRGFLERPEVRDLLNALAAIADPADDVALFGLLRSPAIGFSDPDLHRMRLADGFAVGHLWPTLCQETSPRAQRAAALIETLHTKAGRVTVAELLKQFLDSTNYRAGWMEIGQGRAARNVAKLLDDAVRSGLVGVGEFLEYVANLRDIGSRESEARTDSEGAVQIMSVHQAKGLEFPVVVVGDAGYAGSRQGDAILLDDVYGLVLRRKGDDDRKSPIYTRASARNDDMESAEVARLFYVAATRAQDLLILNGNANEPKGDQLTGKGWLKPILPVLEIEPGRLTEYSELGNRLIAAPANLASLDVRCILCEPQYAFTPDADPAPGAPHTASSQQPADEVPFDGAMLASLSPAPTTKRDDQTPDRVWRVVPARTSTQAPPWLIGKLVHAAIAAWRFPTEPTFDAWAKARSQEYGLTDQPRIDRAIAKSKLLLRRFLNHTLYHEIASADLRLHEIPYGYVRDGQIEEGRIDLLYRRRDLWTVVDFKTDHFGTDEAVRAWINQRGYQDQVERYAAAVATLSGIWPQVKLCLLDHNGVVRVEEMRAGSQE
ncbi:MAG: UvrD-helicase domain-containing protein [Anaerolineales bacterium]|nr:UvrD-helicase domain-containing protein [Anaerolineales bacterium]